MRTFFVLSCFWLISKTTSAQTITRGPYLQSGAQTAVSIRWRTDVPTVGRVAYGLSSDNLSANVSESTSTTEHEIRLSGLTPDSHYFYSVGTTTQVLQQGNDNYFLTAPLNNTKRKIRVASFGDSGMNPNNNQTNVRDAFLNFRGNTPTDLWMLIGDNSYDGDDPAYQTNFFEPYQTNMMKNTMLFAVPGNHDYNNSAALAASHNIPYFSIFSLPTNAEAGGVPSGTKEWYSFDYGPIHFIMLDGFGTRNVNGTERRFFADTVNHPQVAWLKQDLAATTQKWKIVYQHFPPYSHGAHNSDTDPDLIAVRQFINPILEQYGVDLVMLGHSHNYERSYPIHDQYGPSSDFTSNPDAYRFQKDNSTGRYDGSANSCLYKSSSAKKKQGTVYVVAGSAGALGYNPYVGPHPVMVSTERLAGGSFYFDVEDNRLDAKFIQPNPPSSYSISDQFTIMKDVGLAQTLTVPIGQSITLTASYISDYQWSSPTNGGFSASSRSVVVNPAPGITSTYVVHDSKHCVQDVFTVISAGSMFTLKSGNWNDPAIWSGNRVPTGSDALQLKHIVSIPTNTQVHAQKVTYDPGIKLQLGAQAKLYLAN
ncbi:metallophosphoesterase [Spirosoma sp. KCTC 42546]|uniref:purple acid phosphatase family protein n=1 Tax=Spirosoma sp. KCTC 42546 TaxID=2520506 RepID=UPI001157E4E9|nr:metallophosphoesterase family protein [Spirosoma sp. KCTC 42546]QDK79105.1 metallophosphoesterase [Spirosoma sp. KCTC 42546]